MNMIPGTFRILQDHSGTDHSSRRISTRMIWQTAGLLFLGDLIQAFLLFIMLCFFLGCSVDGELQQGTDLPGTPTIFPWRCFRTINTALCTAVAEQECDAQPQCRWGSTYCEARNRKMDASIGKRAYLRNA